MTLLRKFSKVLVGTIISLLFISSPAFAVGYCGDGFLNEVMEECDDGNFAERDGCSAYCHIEDMDPPSIESVSIPNGTEGISSLTSSLTIVFSEPINTETLIKSNVRFEHSAKLLDYDLNLNSDKKTLTIKINQELYSEGSHAIRISNIGDEAGNYMNEEFISVFTTAVAVDHTPPTVDINSPGGEYNFSQDITLTAYVDDYTGSEEFIDPNAKIYFTLDNTTPNYNSTLYESPIQISTNSTLKYFSVDENNNESAVITHTYTFDCPENPNIKKMTPYPRCNIIECNHGFILRNNTCVVSMTASDPDDYKLNAVTAPRLTSAKPMTITTRPAIYITKQHKGNIPRPLIFKDSKRGTIIEFERNTRITETDTGKAFEGYIRPPNNLYLKDFPINFGYSFKSIFEFKAADGRDLDFYPHYRITVPYTDAFEEDEGVTVLNYDPEMELYTEYPKNLYSTDLDKKEVTVKSGKTGIFFIAQKGRSFNKSAFKDTKDHWAGNYIETLYRKGIIRGRSKGIYAPNDPLTRAEFAKIAITAIGEEIDDIEEIEENPFKDVPVFAWYSPYIKKAKELGLIKGYQSGEFKPEQFINRAEAIKILVSAFNFDLDKRKEVEGYYSANRQFSDVKGSQWYYPYVDFAVQYGIVDGIRLRNNKILKDFGPGRHISRGEMAKLAVKAIELRESMDSK